MITVLAGRARLRPRRGNRLGEPYSHLRPAPVEDRHLKVGGRFCWSIRVPRVLGRRISEWANALAHRCSQHWPGSTWSSRAWVSSAGGSGSTATTSDVKMSRRIELERAGMGGPRLHTHSGICEEALQIRRQDLLNHSTEGTRLEASSCPWSHIRGKQCKSSPESKRPTVKQVIRYWIW